MFSSYLYFYKSLPRNNAGFNIRISRRQNKLEYYLEPSQYVVFDEITFKFVHINFFLK